MLRICVAARGRTVNAPRKLAESGAVTLYISYAAPKRAPLGCGAHRMRERCARRMQLPLVMDDDGAAVWQGARRQSRTCSSRAAVHHSRYVHMYEAARGERCLRRLAANAWHTAAPKSAAWQRRRGHTAVMGSARSGASVGRRRRARDVL